MNFDDIIVNIGDFGRFQWTLVWVFLIPTLSLMPCFRMVNIFLLSTPDHWCYVPEVASSGLTLKDQQVLIRPSSNPSCAMYDINYTEIITSGNWTVNQQWPTRPCSYGWQYDTTNYDVTASTKWNLVCEDGHYVSLVLTLGSVGSTVSTPFFGFLSDRLGRKPTFFIIALVTGVTGILSVVIPYFSAFLILQTINGITRTFSYTLVYIIMLELASPSMRTRMNALTSFAWTFGMCFLPLLAWLTRDWVILGIVTYSFSLLFLAFWKLVPESPRWLISQERYEEATEIMMKISRKNGRMVYNSHEMRLLLENVSNADKEENAKANNSLLDLLKFPHLRKIFLIITLCWIANRGSYRGLHFNVTNLSGNEFFNFFLLGLVEVPGNLCGWIFMNRLGRRCCSVSCLILTGIACLIPCIVPAESRFVDVISSVIAKFGSTAAYMALYQQAPELYPTTMRSSAMSVSSTIAKTATFAVPYVVYLRIYGKFIPFLIIATVCIFSGICSAFLPETLNVHLPQTTADAKRFGSISFNFCSCYRRKSSISEKCQCVSSVRRSDENNLPNSKTVEKSV